MYWEDLKAIGWLDEGPAWTNGDYYESWSSYLIARRHVVGFFDWFTYQDAFYF